MMAVALPLFLQGVLQPLSSPRFPGTFHPCDAASNAKPPGSQGNLLALWAQVHGPGPCISSCDYGSVHDQMTAFTTRDPHNLQPFLLERVLHTVMSLSIAPLALPPTATLPASLQACSTCQRQSARLSDRSGHSWLGLSLGGLALGLASSRGKPLAKSVRSASQAQAKSGFVQGLSVSSSRELKCKMQAVPTEKPSRTRLDFDCTSLFCWVSCRLGSARGLPDLTS